MRERALFDLTLWTLAGLGLVTFLVLLAVVAPYGRHARRGFGPLVHGTAGWVVMESAAAVAPAVAFLGAAGPLGALPWIALALWEGHYVYRAFVYPFRRKRAGAMPVAIVAAGFLFNAVNGALNGWWLARLAPPVPAGSLAGPRFLGGLALFVLGLAVHLHSDQVLLDLRARGQDGYAVPHRGLHRLVASPNYLGELVEWIGFAILTASPAAAVFAAWTAANLVPRALANLRWYRRTFPDYPRRRRALVPFVL